MLIGSFVLFIYNTGGDEYMVYKYCPLCERVKIPDEDKVCSKCKELYGEDIEKAKYKRYNRTRMDKESQSFYNSKQWKKIRERVKRRDNGLCLYCLLVKNVITTGDLVHHIVEEKQDKSLRLEEDNLIMLCNSCHAYIHGQYERNDITKTKMQDKLKKLVKER